MKYAVLALALLVTGCATTEEKQPEPVRVEVPVPVPCIERPPARPEYRFGKGDAPDAKTAAMILADDFEKAEQYGAEWEAAAAGCIMQPD